MKKTEMNRSKTRTKKSTRRDRESSPKFKFNLSSQRRQSSSACGISVLRLNVTVTTSMTVGQSQISTRLQLKEVEDAIDLDHVRMNQAMLWRLYSNKSETELQPIVDKKLRYAQQATRAH